MDLSRYVGTLNILGDESRIRLCALLRERELSVTDLVRVTGISQSRVSTHLARLREGGFVRDRKDGPRSFYALAKDSLPDAARVVLDGAVGSADPTLEGDQRRLSELDAQRRGALPQSFAGEMERHYSPGRTWQSLAVGLAALLDLGDVLDVGSGDGTVAELFVRRARSVTLLDVNERRLAVARRRLAAHANAAFVTADMHRLPFEPSSFDQVLLLHVLAHSEEPHVAISEAARVLRPGGRLCVVTLAEHEHEAVTRTYDHANAGFSPGRLRDLARAARLRVDLAEVTSRERRPPHFEVVSLFAEKSISPEPPALAVRTIKP